MGVNFDLGIGKSIGDKIVPQFVMNRPHVHCRYSQLHPLFVEHREIINNLTNHSVSFKFYDNPTEYSDPRLFFDNLIKIINAIKSNPDKFPYFYSFVKKEYFNPHSEHLGSQHIDKPVYINGKECCLVCGWGRCYYYVSETNEIIDLTDKHEIECYDYKIGDDGFSIIEPGEKAIYVIVKESLYEYFKPYIDNMIKIITFAKENGYLVNGEVR